MPIGPGIIPARGRPATLLTFNVERELTPADIMRLMDGSKERVAPPPVQHLRSRHHRTAELLARGKTVAEVAVATGYTPQRIRDLREHDPSFKDLLAQYESQIQAAVHDQSVQLQSQLLDMSEMAAAEINERLEDPIQRKEIPINELRQIMTAGADRTVAPPKTAQPVVTTPTHITFVMPGGRDIRPKEPILVEAPLVEVEPEKDDDD